MIHVYLEGKKRCYFHPHRVVETACERCKTALCGDCLVTYQGQQLCLRCRDELEERYRLEHPPFTERLRAFVTSFRNLLIGLAILAILAVPGYFLVRNVMVNYQLTPEEFARFRYAAAGTFETPDGINVLSVVLEGQVVWASSEADPQHSARRLIDEYWGPHFPGWRSKGNTFPHEIVFQPQNVAAIEKVLLANHPAEPPESYVREFEVLVSLESPYGPWTSVGRWTLEQHAEPQRFTFPKTPARYIMLRIHSNYGYPEYTSLAEFDAFVVPAMRLMQVTPEPTPTPRR
jgi:hypothetical protein